MPTPKTKKCRCGWTWKRRFAWWPTFCWDIQKRVWLEWHYACTRFWDGMFYDTICEKDPQNEGHER
jgi:hypothetical protein